MAQTFKETAHLKTDLKKYHENFDSIDWTIKKKEEVVVFEGCAECHGNPEYFSCDVEYNKIPCPSCGGAK